jgi:hypothetical protein
MIIVIPMAPSATMTVCATTIRKFLTERYWSGESVRMAKTMMTASRPRNGPSRASQTRTGDASTVGTAAVVSATSYPASVAA